MTPSILRRGARAAVALATLGCRGERLAIEPLVIPAFERTPQSADPGLAVAPGSGDLLLSWVGGDEAGWTLFVAGSADSGLTWTAPVRVAGGPEAAHEVHPHGESSPRLVAAQGGRVALAWANTVPAEGRKWPAAMIRFARSTDWGRSWSPPITLNDDTTGAPVSHQFHGAAWQGDSGLVVAWLDERLAAADRAGVGDRPAGAGASEPDAMIYATTSPDFGRTWGANVPLWDAACPCCRVSLARGSAGVVTAAWRQHFPGDVRDIVAARILPAAPPAPARVHADEWVYPGCPHSGPAVAATGDGIVHAAWYSGKPGASGVFYRHLAPGGEAAGPLVALLRVGRAPTAHAAVLPLNSGGALVAYDIGPQGDRVVRLALVSATGRRVADMTVAASAGGAYPQLVLAAPRLALLAYTVTRGDRRAVHVARIRIPA